MKRVYLTSFFFLFIMLVSCDDDDEDAVPIIPDTVAPEVTIIEPTANDSVVVIDMIEVLAKITDETRLDSVRVVLTEPGGDKQVLYKISTASIGISRDYDLYDLYQIPENAASGDYTIMVEAKDKGLNVAKDSVTITVHASDINNETFANALERGLFNSKFTDGLNELGYNPWEFGIVYDSVWFSTVLHLMVSTDSDIDISEAEWNRFTADFNVRDQSWAEWDQNSDGSLSFTEFNAGLSSLNLYNDWDQNQDDLFDSDEVADGIFARWDFNNDEILSREEYQEKFYTYLYRE